MNVQENVHDNGSGNQSPSHVAGWKTPACAVPSSGLPASTKRFHRGRRPLTMASRTAARQGRLANARSDSTGFCGDPTFSTAAICRHGSVVK